MRNDAFDEVDRVPSLKADIDDHDEAPRERRQSRPPAAPVAGAGRRGSGLLWVLVVALIIALGGLGWWSHQQLMAMQAQLVATQESFVRISEEAAGRIQDIGGKVIAAESSATTGSEALRLQVRQLQQRLDEMSKARQQAEASREAQQGRLDTLEQGLQAQRQSVEAQQKELATLRESLAGLSQAQSQVAQLSERVGELQAAQKGLDNLPARVEETRKQVQALQAGDPQVAIRGLQQDLLLLRSELEMRPAASQGPSTAEFDAYRAQVTRNLNSLQSQLQSLSQRIGQ